MRENEYLSSSQRPMNRDSISINKYISSAGLCSRREADQWIEAGRVSINGQPAAKGNRVNEGDEVLIDGKALRKKSRHVYLVYHKSPGVTTTTDHSDKSNIIDKIGFPERIFPIGRLDKSSTGLILLTSNGDIVNPILRKENKHEKEYIVTVDKPINNRFLQQMSQSIPMLGTRTLPCKVEQIGDRAFRIILTQGLNRQIRRMVEFCGYKVRTLKRIRIMHIHLDDLKVGAWRFLTRDELKALLPE